MEYNFLPSTHIRFVANEVHTSFVRRFKPINVNYIFMIICLLPSKNYKNAYNRLIGTLKENVSMFELYLYLGL